MSETNNFQINLLTKNPIIYLCETLPKPNNKNCSENLLDECQK